MPRTAQRLCSLAALAGAGLLLTGCIQSRLHIGDEFGAAVRQNTVAQVADPDARYRGTPPAGSNGMRTGIAQARYEHNHVIPPASMTTSNVAVGGGGGNGGGSGE